MNKEYIIEKFREAGFEISDKKAEMFAEYCDMLVEWSKIMNLTAVKDEKEIVSRHFTDSLLPLKTEFIKEGAKCVDVGTGAGFPGVPIAIMRDDIEMTLLDSLQKRLTFLDAVIRKLGLENCKTVHSRAEDAARGYMRENFDVVFSRAVAKTGVLAEFCIPLVREGGYMLALKSVTAKTELEEAEKAIAVLGGGEAEIFGTDDRNIVVIKKIKNTPEKYPRRSAKAVGDPIK
ncbi:MAG: 16S rRNA (guanine(527)-N(7))-methyltransferase RsmG [Clostridia bacterium]|nr:16S rRNA (guanine(527)-N(7))-methyltransferase RsmG [Clostridia bacterium]